MGINQRMASSGTIASRVGITINKRIESKTPVSSMKSGTIVSRVRKRTVRKIGRPDPVRSVVDSIIPGAAFLPGGSAAGATDIVVKHPDIIIGSILPPVAIMGGPTGTPGYVAKKSTDELIVSQVKNDPNIPQEIKNDIQRKYIGAYAQFEKDVYTMPDIKMPEIKTPEIKMPEIKFPSLLPGFSGVGKWLLIAGAILILFLIFKK